MTSIGHLTNTGRSTSKLIQVAAVDNKLDYTNVPLNQRLWLCQGGSEIQNTHLTWTDYHSFNHRSTCVIHLQIAKEVNLSKPFRALASNRLVDNITKTSAHAQKSVTHTWRKKGGTWVSQQLRCVIRSSQGTIFTIIFLPLFERLLGSRNLTEKIILP